MAYRFLAFVLATTSGCELYFDASSEAPDDPPSSHPPAGSLAFVVRDPASQSHFGKICVLAPGANATTCFSPEVGYAGAPAWSHDGSLLVYQTTEENFSARSVRVMYADGTGSHEVTAGGRIEDWVAWSPTRTELVFTSGEGSSLFRADATGTGVAQLTTDTQDSEPAWSHDGESIVFVSYRDGLASTGKLYVMDRNGGNVRRFTGLPAAIGERQPRYSPDGTMVTFETYRYDAAQHAISGGVTYIANADGSNLRDANAWLQEPIGVAALALYWSPDMRQLAYVSQGMATDELRVIDPAASPLAPHTVATGLMRGTIAWDPCNADRLAVRIGWIDTRKLVFVDVPSGAMDELPEAGNVDGHFGGLSWAAHDCP